jgi:type I restriction enzyme, S subunit
VTEDSFLKNIDLVLKAPNGIDVLRKFIINRAIMGRLDSNSLQSNSYPSNWKIIPAKQVFKSKSGNSKLIKGKLFNQPDANLFPGYSASGQDVWLADWEHQGVAAILSAVGARCGKAFMATGKWSAIANTHIIWIDEEVFLPEFAYLILNNEDFWIRSGSAQPFVKVKATLDKLIGVPPLEDQRSIISKFNTVTAILADLQAAKQDHLNLSSRARVSALNSISTAQTHEDLKIAWARIQDNWDVIAGKPEAVDVIKTLILDLAVRGDLVTSNNSKVVKVIKWTSSELKLDDSKLWSLPTLHKEKKDGWNRIPLAKLGSWGSGGTPTSSRKDYYQNGTIPWAVIGDMNNEIMTSTEARITEKALLESSSKLVPVGAILIAMYGASIGKTAITGIQCCTNQAIAHCIVDTKIVSKEYFFIVAKSLKRHLIQEGKGAAQPNISQSVLKHLVIDLPPQDEQEKIVERVEALMHLCDRLNLSLRESELLAEKFSRSVVSASA